MISQRHDNIDKKSRYLFLLSMISVFVNWPFSLLESSNIDCLERYFSKNKFSTFLLFLFN